MRGPDAARPLLNDEARPVPRPRPAPPITQVSTAVALDLIWFDEARIADAVDVLDEDLRSLRKGEPETRLRGLMRSGRVSSLASLEGQLLQAFDDGTPALALASGRLRSLFDVRDELETAVALARPFAVEGENLQREVAHAEALLQTPIEGAPEVARGLRERIERAWSATASRRAAYDLEIATRRVLLTSRAYRRAGVLGGSFLEAELNDGSDVAVVYLPEVLAERLPLLSELDVRLVVSVHPRQDVSATSSVALRALAVARMD